MGRRLQRPYPSWCGAIVVCGFLAFCLWPHTLSAQNLFAKSGENTAATFETFSGVDATSNSLFGYAGFAWAFGRDVTAEGFRLKALAGTGGYDYDSTLSGIAGPVNFDGEVVLARVLAGYLWRCGEWTVKAYAGIGYEAHDITPNDPANRVNGHDAGIAVELGVWRNLGRDGFLSLNGSYAEAFDSYYAQARLGRRFTSRFSGGLEGAALGNEEYESGRGGGFLRYHMRDVELTLSGGVSGDFYTQDLGSYATLGLYARF